MTLPPQPDSPTTTDPVVAVDDAFGALVDHLVEHAPVLAGAMGAHGCDERLDDWSTGGIGARLDDLDRLDSQLAAIDLTGAAPEVVGDHRLVVDEVASLRFELCELERHHHDPLTYLDLATSAVFELLRRDDRPVEARRRGIAARLAEVPRLMEQGRTQLTGVPQPHRDVALMRVQGAVTLIGEVAATFAPDTAGVAADAARAVGSFGAWLRDGEGEPAPEWRLGAERWEEALARTTGADLGGAEVHRRAKLALSETIDAAEEAAAQVLGGRTGGRSGRELITAGLDVCAADAPPAEALVDRARGVLGPIRDFVVADGVFPMPSTDDLRVEEVPSFQRGVAVAFFRPPPPLDPEAPATYYLSPIPEGWEEAQVASFLREYNRHALVMLGIHEAYPGHHLQMAHAMRHPRRVRRSLLSSGYAEGWAVYAEDVMLERGFLEDTPDGDCLRLTAQKMRLRTIANTLLDQGLHVHGWDDERARRLLISEVLQEPAEVEGKMLRAKVSAGQLSSYFVGGQEVTDLRAAVEARDGAGFDARAFHADVLSRGTPPVAVLRNEML